VSSKKHGYGASAVRSKSGPPVVAPVQNARAIKRSITVQPDVDAALREIAGDREYSQVANEAFVLYIQARGIETIVRDIERLSGPSLPT
jgi:uncharacterized protein (DUF169 family)